MNTLNILPLPLRKIYIKNITNAGIKTAPKTYYSKQLLISFFISVILSFILYFFKVNGLIVFASSFVALQIFFFFRISLASSARIKKMETAFPDLIELMSSNLRAGMTVDRAFLLSARPEFSPLDEEVIRAGKEIATGKEISYALFNMSKRISSEKISKTISLIISGMRGGGNISTLLEQTASNMRDKEFIEKRAASSILMYVIFISIAVSVGAPLLFGLSSILIEIIIDIVSKMPAIESAQMDLPLTFTQINISVNFVIYFALILIIVTDIISCLVIGLVNKGDEKAGLKYLIPILIASISIFFGVRIFLYKFVAQSFSLAQ